MVASPRKSRATDPVANQLLNKYLKRMGSIPLLSRADEIEVSRRVREGGPESELAKVALINANLRLLSPSGNSTATAACPWPT